ncbi:MAG: hypothetical protein HQ474_08275 [Flammeovirgaceae bacterium]|nr:hypothetical protein [Flammeovirgaceae bacterium]
MDKVKTYYDAKIASSRDLELIYCRVIPDFDKRRNFELSYRYREEFLDAHIIPQKFKTDYINTFSPAQYEPQWALEYKVRRPSMNRELTLYYFTGEGLDCYWALSQGGIFAPNVFCTIQTGMLEQPSGMMEHFFSRTRVQPLLWVKGFEADWPLSYNYNKAFKSTAGYDVVAMDFIHPWKVGWSYEHQQSHIRHCKAFTRAQTTLHIKRPEVCIEFHGHRFVHESILDQEVSFGAEDVLVLTKHLARKLTRTDLNLILWEDIIRRYPSHEQGYMSVRKQIQILNRFLKHHNYRKVHIVPFCYEDEGINYLSAMELLHTYEVCSYLYRPFDFCDLRTAFNGHHLN